MSDTAPRNQTFGPQMIADALLRNVGGTSALFQVTNVNTQANQSEVGLLSTTFVDVVVSPVIFRKLRPSWNENGESKFELLVSATGLEQQINALDIPSVQSLFQLTLSVTVAGQAYLIESISTSEAFGSVYLYRLLLRIQTQQAI